MHSPKGKWLIHCPIMMKTENVSQVHKTAPHEILWK